MPCVCFFVCVFVCLCVYVSVLSLYALVCFPAIVMRVLVCGASFARALYLSLLLFACSFVKQALRARALSPSLL